MEDSDDGSDVRDDVKALKRNGSDREDNDKEEGKYLFVFVSYLTLRAHIKILHQGRSKRSSTDGIDSP